MNNLDKQLLIEKYNNNPKGWRKWLSAQKILLAELEKEYPFLNNVSEQMYWLVNDIKEYPHCITCGKVITKFVGKSIGYNKHCCCRCAQLDIDTQNKQKQTKLNLYGDENYNNMTKHKETCLNRYGVDNIRKSDLFKQHAQQVKLEKYNDINYNNRASAKQTCIDKYGATTFIHSESGKEILSNIMLEKYGATHHWKNNEIHQKCYDTLIAKYGGVGNGAKFLKDKCENTLQLKTGYKHNWSNPECRNKCYNTCLEKYGTEHPVLLHSPRGVTKGQREVFEFISGIYPGNIILNDRHLRDDNSHIYELDIFIPDINFAIEYDGDYWHSLPNMVLRDNIKDQLCRNNNIKLFRISESEWKNNSDIIKQTIIEELLTNEYI